jgi:hypothetical protein
MVPAKPTFTPKRFKPSEADDRVTTRLLDVVKFANEGNFERQKLEGTYPWYKAIDMVHFALRLSGVVVCDTNSETGGSSVTMNRRMAQEYLGTRGDLSVEAIKYYLGEDAIYRLRSTRFVAGLTSDLSSYLVAATHMGNEGPAERIAKSMHLSDFDSNTRNTISTVFGLPPDFNMELIQNAPTRPADLDKVTVGRATIPAYAGHCYTEPPALPLK